MSVKHHQKINVFLICEHAKSYLLNLWGKLSPKLSFGVAIDTGYISKNNLDL